MSEARRLPRELQTFEYRDGKVIASLVERDGYRSYSVFVFDSGEPLPGPDAPISPFIR